MGPPGLGLRCVPEVVDSGRARPSAGGIACFRSSRAGREARGSEAERKRGGFGRVSARLTVTGN